MVTNMSLPNDFLNRMQHMLRASYEDFLNSYENERVQGLRINTLKTKKEDFLKNPPFVLEQIPWAENGFYYPDCERPGKHPYHDAGVYYIQEPSAMAVAEAAEVEPGERVLDLCAAPGGKTTQLAAAMQGKGILVANEIHPSRAKILSQNVERMGISNAVVTNETPEALAARFPAFFDCIVVDAPCSGEGMFRKEPQVRQEWSLNHVAMCAERQREILNHAAAMLKAGGRLIYSTCTFSPEENEGTIYAFLKRNPEFEIENSSFYDGFSNGSPEWGNNLPQLQLTSRLWPHLIRGEGHYMARLRKTDGENRIKYKYFSGSKELMFQKDLESFRKKFLNTEFEGERVLFGEQMYLVPEGMITFEKLRVLRPGLHLGTLKKNRFEPAHALALAISENAAVQSISWNADSAEIREYLKGEVLENCRKLFEGWVLIAVDGYSLGWGKQNGTAVKNHYPKGLRIM